MLLVEREISAAPKKIAFGGQREPFGDVIGQWTTCNAIGIGTLDATTGLFADGGFVVEGIDFVEIGDPRFGGTFGRADAVNFSPGMLGFPFK